MSFSRRNFLKMTGAVTTAAMVGCEKEGKKVLAPYRDIPEGWSHEEVRNLTSVCGQCPAGCGIKVKLYEGRAIKIEGNPEHPLNLGGLCPKGLSGLQGLYDPDRIRTPLRKKGPRDSFEFESITWEEGIAELTKKIRSLQDRHQTHKIAVVGRFHRDGMRDYFDRFLSSIGSPNLVTDDTDEIESLRAALFFTQGIHDYPAFNFANTNYLICFGNDFLEDGKPFPMFLRDFGAMRRGRPGKRTKIVYVGSRLSISGSRADEWIPINPGTDGALALGIAHLLIKSMMYDHKFCAHHTFGFDDWVDLDGVSHSGFKNIVMAEYPVDRVSSITGVPINTIKRIASEFGRNRPAVALAGRNAVEHTNGVLNAMAIHSLNALSGSFEVPGGIRHQHTPPLASLPSPSLPPISHERLDGAGTVALPFAETHLEKFVENALAGKPYELELLMLYRANPAYHLPSHMKFSDLLAKVPYLVSFSSHMDESTKAADLILPDSHYLEKWGLVEIEPSTGTACVGLRKPVVPTLYKTRDTMEVLAQTAKALGGGSASAIPWESRKQTIRIQSKGLFEKKTGSVITENYEEFWTTFVEHGGWWDLRYFPEYWEKVFPNPGSRFGFYSQTMQHRLKEVAVAESERESGSPEYHLEQMLKNIQGDARRDRIFMPRFEAPRFSGAQLEYPLHLLVYRGIHNSNGDLANQPWQQETYDLHNQEMWSSWVEINPETARRHGVHDGDMVWVESPFGQLKVKAWLYEGIMPNTIAIPLGKGHTAGGRWSEKHGINPIRILGNARDRLTSRLASQATHVKLHKA